MCSSLAASAHSHKGARSQTLNVHRATGLASNQMCHMLLHAGFVLKCKYKGASNRNTQIRGTFSQSGHHLICGSDDGWVYVWDTQTRRASPSLQDCGALNCCLHDSTMHVCNILLPW